LGFSSSGTREAKLIKSEKASCRIWRILKTNLPRSDQTIILCIFNHTVRNPACQKLYSNEYIFLN
jgi:hypothetical protein